MLSVSGKPADYRSISPDIPLPLPYKVGKENTATLIKPCLTVAFDMICADLSQTV